MRAVFYLYLSMDKKLAALLDDLMARAFDPRSQKYNFRDANEVIKKHFERISEEGKEDTNDKDHQA